MLSDFALGDVIAEHSYGKLFKSNFKNKVCIVQVIYSRFVTENVDLSAFKEVTERLNNTNHPAVAKVIKADVYDDLVIVYEIPAHFSTTLETKLLEPVEDGTVKFTVNQMRCLMTGIASGLHRLHHLGIVHGDLCDKNILLNDNYEPCLIGFGISAFLKDYVTCPDVRYMPPEIMSQGQLSSSKQTDLYSFGMLVLAVINGKRPFNEFGEWQFVKKIACNERPDIPNIVSEKCKTLLEHDVSEIPSVRMSISETLYLIVNDRRYCINGTDVEDEEFSNFKSNYLPISSLDILDIEKLEKDMTHGNIESMYRLGMHYIKGEKGVHDEDLGCNLLRKAADLGNRDAANDIGLMAEKNGDLGEAMKYFKMGSDMQNPEAIYNYGRLLESSNPIKSARKMRAAGDLGHIEAAYKYAWFRSLSNDVPGDLEDSHKYFKKAADGNHREAKYCYAVQCEKGLGCAPNYQEAAQYYQEAAEMGHLDAMNCLGTLYQNGTGVEQNYREALKLYEDARSRGNIHAIFNCAYMYENGLGCETNIDTAKQLYRETADEHDYGMAQHNLANIYERESNYHEAERYYLMAVSKQIHSSEYNLGLIYRNGLGGIEVNEAKAAELIEKASQGGNPSSQYLTGNKYYKERDFDKAFDYYSKACKQGHVKATWRTAMMIWNGNVKDQDIHSTLQHFSFLAAKRHYPGMAMYGGILLDGKLTQQDKNAGVDYVREAAENGEPYGQYRYGLWLKKTDRESAKEWLRKSANAQNVDAMYEYGRCCNEDECYKDACTYFNMAAEKKHWEALCEVSILMYKGNGCEKNIEEAKKSMRRSANHNCIKAMYKYGRYVQVDGDSDAAMVYFKKAADAHDKRGEYYYARGIMSSNPDEALEYFNRSAKSEYPKAQYEAARFYEHGIGSTARDYQRAVELYRSASNHGFMPATVNLGILHKWGRGVRKSYKEANECFRTASKNSFVLGKIHFHLLRIETDQDQDGSHVEKLSEYVNDTECGAYAKFVYGKCLMESGQSDTGSDYIKMAVNSGVPEALSYYARGIADMDEKVDLLRRAVEMDDPDGQTQLGVVRLSQGNKTEALRLFKHAAEQCFPEGECHLAMLMQENGENINDVMALYQKAIDGGNTEARFRMARIVRLADCEKAIDLLNGCGQHVGALKLLVEIHRERNNGDAVRSGLETLASLGDTDSKFEYGNLLLESDERDAALVNFDSAYRDGHVKAAIAAGKIYEAAENRKEAEQRYLFAADQKDMDGQYHAALLLENENENHAISLFKQAASSGHCDAAYRVGIFYKDKGMNAESEEYLRMADERGSLDGTYELALLLNDITLLKKAADQNHVRSCKELGHRYLHANNTEEAARYLMRATENDPDVSFECAQLIESSDPEEAIRLYEFARDSGMPASKLPLAKLCIQSGNGKFVEGIEILRELVDNENAEACWLLATHTDDNQEKLKCYQTLAELQDAKAEVELGKLAQSDADKVYWLEQASNHGDHMGHFLYAQLLIEGRIVDKDLVKARNLLEASDLPEAKNLLASTQWPVSDTSL